MLPDCPLVLFHLQGSIFYAVTGSKLFSTSLVQEAGASAASRRRVLRMGQSYQISPHRCLHAEIRQSIADLSRA